MTLDPMPGAVVDTTPQWRRLSPRMLLVHPVIEAGKAVPAIAGALLAGGGSLGGTVWAGGIAVAVMAYGVVRWFTTRYLIGTEQIQLQHGLIRRRSSTTRLDRVRTVDITSHPLHRVLGIARVVVGTGTSDTKNEDRLVLDGLGVDQAARMRAALLHRGAAPARGAGLTADPVDETLVELDPRWIRYAPFMLTGAVTGLAILGLGWRIISEGNVHLNRLALARSLQHDVERWSPVTAVLVGALAVTAFVVVASTVGYVLSFWGFTLGRNPAGSLHVSRGLLTTRRTSIERRRLIGVEVSEPLLLRSAHGARVLAVATGLRVGRGAERGGGILLPPAPVAVATELAAELVDGARAAIGGQLSAHPRTALRRRMIRAVGASAVGTGSVAVVVAASGLSWSLVALAAVSVVLAVPLARDRYRSLGHALVGRVFVTRVGTVVRRRTSLDAAGIVGWTFRSSWFQRRLGLTTLFATTAAGRQKYAVEDLSSDEAVAFADHVVPHLLTQFLATAE